MNVNTRLVPTGLGRSYCSQDKALSFPHILSPETAPHTLPVPCRAPLTSLVPPTLQCPVFPSVPPPRPGALSLRLGHSQAQSGATGEPARQLECQGHHHPLCGPPRMESGGNLLPAGTRSETRGPGRRETTGRVEQGLQRASRAREAGLSDPRQLRAVGPGQSAPRAGEAARRAGPWPAPAARLLICQADKTSCQSEDK